MNSLEFPPPPKWGASGVNTCPPIAEAQRAENEAIGLDDGSDVWVIPTDTAAQNTFALEFPH